MTGIILFIEVLAMVAFFITWGVVLVKSLGHKLDSKQYKIVRYGNYIFIAGLLLLVVVQDIFPEGWVWNGISSIPGGWVVYSNDQWALYALLDALALIIMFMGILFIKAANRKYKNIPGWIRYISSL